jgi:hypothetical protein
MLRKDDKEENAEEHNGTVRSGAKAILSVMDLFS